MTDFDKTVPNAANTVDSDITAVRQNNEVIERGLLMDPLLIDGHYAEFTYTGDKVTTITVKNSGGTTVGTCTLVYSGDNISTETWVINGETLTYTYTYSGSNITKRELQIT